METEIQNPKKKKKILIRIGIIFLAVIILATYYSKTIYNSFLTEVEIVKPFNGSLEITSEGDGVVKTANTKKIFSPGQWRIKEVKVKENDKVAQRQELVVVDIDDANAEVKKMETAIDSLQKEIDKYKNLSEGDDKKDNELNIIRCENDLEVLKIQMDNYKRTIPDNGVIKADSEGIVENIGIKEGMVCSSGQQICDIKVLDNKYMVEWLLNSEKGSGISTEDDVSFEKEDPTEKTSFSGKISSKLYIPEQGIYRLTSEIDGGDKLQDNDRVNIKVTKQLGDFPLIVPNTCITESNGDTYVFVVKSQSTSLGEMQYVEKVNITIKASDEFNSAVEGKLIAGETKVVAFSPRALSTGMQVRTR